MKDMKLRRCDEAKDKSARADIPCELPDDIIVYILSYLPVSYLLKFKCVCKRWNTLFLHPLLSYLHDRNYAQTDLDLQDVSLHHPSSTSSFYAQFSRSSQGLFLDKSTSPLRYRLECFTLRQMLHIPNPQNPSLCIALEFVPSNQAVKLVSVHQHEENHLLGYEILTLGIGNDPTTYCWRPVNDLQQNNQINGKRTRIQFLFRMGVAYCIWHVETPAHDHLDIEIDILDMVNETYIGHTTFPRGFFSKLSSTNILDWNGRLSFTELVKDELHVLVLDDYSKLKWAENKRIIKLPFLKPDNKELITFSICADKKLFFVRQDEDEDEISRCEYDINTGKLDTSVMEGPCSYSAEDLTAEVVQSMFFKGHLGINGMGF